MLRKITGADWNSLPARVASVIFPGGNVRFHVAALVELMPGYLRPGGSGAHQPAHSPTRMTTGGAQV